MAKASRRRRRAARTKQKKIQKTAKLGSGKRFSALVASVKAGGAKNPGAVAAMIGRKKYGPKRMAKLAIKGRKKK